MKKQQLLLFSLILTTSCISVKNNINRASVSEGEVFVKYGVEGFPEGVEVYKGSECMMTANEIKRHYEDVDRANELQRQERFDSIKKSDEELFNYIRKVRSAYQDTVG